MTSESERPSSIYKRIMWGFKWSHFLSKGTLLSRREDDCTEGPDRAIGAKHLQKKRSTVRVTGPEQLATASHWHKAEIEAKAGEGRPCRHSEEWERKEAAGLRKGLAILDKKAGSGVGPRHAQEAEAPAKACKRREANQTHQQLVRKGDKRAANSTQRLMQPWQPMLKRPSSIWKGLADGPTLEGASPSPTKVHRPIGSPNNTSLIRLCC
jgi:hypothetical protein